jgi:hypothetical protein
MFLYYIEEKIVKQGTKIGHSIKSQTNDQLIPHLKMAAYMLRSQTLYIHQEEDPLRCSIC